MHHKALALALWDGCRAGSRQERQRPFCDNGRCATASALPPGHKDAQICQQNLQSPGTTSVAEAGMKARVSIKELPRAAKHPVPLQALISDCSHVLDMASLLILGLELRTAGAGC